MLIFSNKTGNDIILKEEFETILGDRFINVITDEPTEDHIYLGGYIDKEFLESTIDDFSKAFYVCGPKPFNEAIIEYLKAHGTNPDALIFEE